MNPRQQNKRKKYLNPATVIIVRQVLLGIMVFAAVAGLIAAVWYVTRISSFTINTITISGGITIDEEMVKSRVEEKLSGAYLKIVPKRFVYFYPAEEIFNNISQIERIKNVKVEKISGQEIRVTFSEYIPDSLLCSLNEETKCYFLDDGGFAFGLAPTLSGESVIRYYSSENVAATGIRPFLEIDYQATKDFIKRLAEIGWFVTRVEINSARDVFYTLSQGGEIKATLSEETVVPFSNLEVILKSKEFSHLKPGNFQYVDLRFGNRVFVNEESIIITATSTVATTSDQAIE